MACCPQKGQLLVLVTEKNSPLLPKKAGPELPSHLGGRGPWTEPVGTFSAGSCFVWRLLYVAFPQLPKALKLGQGESFNLTRLKKRLCYLPWWYSSVTDTLKPCAIPIHSRPQERQKGTLPASCCEMGGPKGDPRGQHPTSRVHSKKCGKGPSRARGNNRHLKKTPTTTGNSNVGV